jgi:phosphocarrier protein
MVERQITVVNSLGIHARPASQIVLLANKFNATISLVKDGAVADAKSIMSVMMLAAAHNSTITLRVSGPDEQVALGAMIELFANKFNEE